MSSRIIGDLSKGGLLDAENHCLRLRTLVILPGQPVLHLTRFHYSCRVRLQVIISWNIHIRCLILFAVGCQEILHSILHSNSDGRVASKHRLLHSRQNARDMLDNDLHALPVAILHPGFDDTHPRYEGIDPTRRSV